MRRVTRSAKQHRADGAGKQQQQLSPVWKHFVPQFFDTPAMWSGLCLFSLNLSPRLLDGQNITESDVVTETFKNLQILFPVSDGSQPFCDREARGVHRQTLQRLAPRPRWPPSKQAAMREVSWKETLRHPHYCRPHTTCRS